MTVLSCSQSCVHVCQQGMNSWEMRVGGGCVLLSELSTYLSARARCLGDEGER